MAILRPVSTLLFIEPHVLSQDILTNIEAETFHSKDWFDTSKENHGYDGHLHTEPHDLAPISNLIKDSMVSKGLPLDHDMFAHGNNPHGCGHATRTVYKGLRTTGADFVTKPQQKNVDLLVETHVDKIIIQKDENGDLKATGVRAIKADGSVIELKARKEIIVSGGSYCSPNILNRSGIGAKDELEKHGITTLVDLPGVGKNLMDHLVCEADHPHIQIYSLTSSRSSSCSTKLRRPV